MANEDLGRGILWPRLSVDRRIAEAGFVVLLLLIFVGLSPFDDRSAASLAARQATAASGDIARQVSFLGTFAVIVFAAWRKNGLAMARAVPVGLVVLMAWCALSTTWAAEPDVVARRAILAAIFVASIMLSVDTLGAERAVALWRYVIAGVILADVLSVALVHQAVHLSSDAESNLAGAWRGFHSHKNSAGAFAATAAAMFFFFALESRRRSDILLCIVSLAFLVMTQSKTSLALLPVALIAGGFYRLARRSNLDRAIVAVAITLLALIILVVASVQWEFVARFLEDPEHFTGRAAIWQAEIHYVRDHPLLGAGFGTFGNTGTRSPIYYYVGGSWLSQIGEGHSGYLEILVTIGGIGLVLCLITLIIRPFMQFWEPERKGTDFNAMLFSLFFFDLLHNFMESDFISVTALQWGQLLLIIAVLRVSRREARESALSVAA